MFHEDLNAYGIEVVQGLLDAGDAAGVAVVVSRRPDGERDTGVASQWVSDLAAAGQPGGQKFHYYVNTSGAIMRLVDEGQAIGDPGAITIGLEPSGSVMPDEQASAMEWLLSDLKQRYGLSDAQLSRR